MRQLMQRIRLVDRRLQQQADRILRMRAARPADALAKLKLGLRLQQPAGEDVSWQLMQSGFGELVALWPEECGFMANAEDDGGRATPVR